MVDSWIEDGYCFCGCGGTVIGDNSVFIKGHHAGWRASVTPTPEQRAANLVRSMRGLHALRGLTFYGNDEGATHA